MASMVPQFWSACLEVRLLAASNCLSDREQHALHDLYLHATFSPDRISLPHPCTTLVAAFTPTCTEQHLPGLMSVVDSLIEGGVDRIAVVTTNDRHVNSAWRQGLEAQKASTKAQFEKLVMLSDADGDCVKALGLAEDMGYGYGVRSKRFTLLVENGIVKSVAVDSGIEDLKECAVENLERTVSRLVKAPTPAKSVEEDKNTAVLVGGAAVAAALAYAFMNGNGHM
mmetsp:Transcript_643/g.1744  ORF Transcript_643/g.1744 Transcript_643/m.1744 type:complete len:226 (+) Transcript_643:279-956(+)